MSVVDGIAIPESLLNQVRKMTEEEGISVQQFIASATAEKASAWMTVEYLRERGRRGSREEFERIMAKVPDVEPADEDKFE